MLMNNHLTPFKRILLLPGLSCLLYLLGAQGYPFSLAAWICLVPFVLSLHRATPWQGVGSGFFCGFGFWFSSVWWLKIDLVTLVGLPPWQAWLCTLLFSAWHALPYALFGGAAARFRWLERSLTIPLAALSLVVIRAWFPHIFSGNEAHLLYEWPLLIQTLDLGGTPLLLFLVYLVNFLIARGAVLRREQGSPLGSLAAAAMILLLLSGYGVFRLSQMHQQMAGADERQTVAILSVQPNLPVTPNVQDVPPEDRHNNMASTLAFTRAAALQHPTAELVVLPELPCGDACANQTAGDIPPLAVETGRIFMVPCLGLSNEASRSSFNSVICVGKSGVISEEYRKQVLVPFGEYLPFESRFPWLRRLFPGVMYFQPGEKSVLFDLGQGRLAIPSLCYEAIFSGHIRRFVEKGGNLLVNMVDDGWFGNSGASVTHLSLALFRSVEFRIPLARVANSGISVCVQPTGEIVPGTRTLLFKKAVTEGRLYIPEERSPYTGWGDTLFRALSICWGAGMTLALLVRRSRPTQLAAVDGSWRWFCL